MKAAALNKLIDRLSAEGEVNQTELYAAALGACLAMLDDSQHAAMLQHVESHQRTCWEFEQEINAENRAQSAAARKIG